VVVKRILMDEVVLEGEGQLLKVFERAFEQVSQFLYW
jgi:hypothetical protein